MFCFDSPRTSSDRLSSLETYAKINFRIGNVLEIKVIKGRQRKQNWGKKSVALKYKPNKASANFMGVLWRTY